MSMKKIRAFYRKHPEEIGTRATTLRKRAERNHIETVKREAELSEAEDQWRKDSGFKR